MEINAPNEYEERYCDISRTLTINSFLGFNVVRTKKHDIKIHWTGKFFKKLECVQMKKEFRTCTFDDGLTYTMMWSKWEELWYTIKIDNKELI